MRSSSKIFVRVIAATSLFLCVCAAPAAGPARPRWIELGKSDDSVFCYRVGHVENQPDPAQARQAAYRNALESLAGELALRAGLPEEDRAEAISLIRMPGAELVSEAVHYEAPGSCWVMARIPLADRKAALDGMDQVRSKLIESAAKGATLNAAWERVRSLAAQGQSDSALNEAKELLAAMPEARKLKMNTDDVQLFIGNLHAQRGANLEARRVFDSLMATSSNAAIRAEVARKVAALPPPPLAWPLKARMGERRIAIACWQKKGDAAPVSFSFLTEKIMQTLREIELDVVALPFAADEMDEPTRQALAGQADKAGAAFVLALEVSVDPALIGKTTDVSGFPMPAMDTQVDIALLLKDGTIHYRDTLRDMTAGQINSKTADRIALLVIKNYLLKKLSALPVEPTPL